MDPDRILRVKSLGRAVEDQQLGIVKSAEDEVQIAVAVQVRAADPVRSCRGQCPIGHIAESVGSVQEYVRSGVTPDRVFGRVRQNQVRVSVIVQIAADGLDRAPARHIPSPLRGESVRLSEIDRSRYVPQRVAAEVIYEYHPILAVLGGPGQQYPTRILGD